jgi:uncharacterized protein
MDEAEDGADAIAWAATQPWSSGVVGMVGASYYGATQWLAAPGAPGALKAFAPYVTAIDYHGGWTYRGGAFELGFNLHWTLLFLALGEAKRRLQAGSGSVAQLQEALSLADETNELYRHLPLRDMPSFRELAPYYDDWLSHPAADEYWAPISLTERFGEISAPALIIGGWHDLFLAGAFAGYRGLRDGGGSGARHPRLIVGPWAHGQLSGAYAERQFGLRAGADAVDLTGIQLEWFDRHLKDEGGAGSADDAELPVKLFVMGPNVWRDEADWPLPDTRYTNWFLNSDGPANTSSGDGNLTMEAVQSGGSDSWTYDPSDPVPTVGGASFLPALQISANSGPRDQSEVERRADVLCFTSAPLEEDLEVIGHVRLILFCSSSALDTDFTGKLVNLGPDGRAEIVTDGILRARYRESMSTAVPLVPGEVHQLEIDLSATAYVFPRGHCLRLDVSSSNFPRFDRNPNHGGDIASATEADFVVATNVVYHGPEYPSRLILSEIHR